MEQAAMSDEALLEEFLETGRISDGAVARAAGFDIYVSTDLENEMVALTEEGVTFAQQIAGMEAYRREKGFDDGVKALSLCGARVLQADCVAVYTLPA